MARNGSGTYNRAVSPYTAGTTITAATVNSEMDDIATALTGSMARDGQSPPTANLPMGGFRLTGLGNAVASTDAAPLGQVVAKAGDTMTGALGFAVGTAALPGVFPAGDTNTGFFQAAAAPDTLSISVGGTEVARYGTGGFMRLADGTAAAPAYSFTGDPDTGIYNIGPNVIGFSIGGSKGFEVTPNAVMLDSIPGSAEATYFARCSDASATNNRATTLLSLNENSTPITTVRQTILTDGSGSIELYATPAGSRASDRRVNRMIIPGSGAITVSGDLEASGNLRFNSGYGSAAIAYGVRAWVNFNGTGTVAIRASGGVTSITDNGTGDYTVNFNFTMPDTNYAAVANYSKTNSVAAGNDGQASCWGNATTSVKIYVTDGAANAIDPLYCNLFVVR